MGDDGQRQRRGEIERKAKTETLAISSFVGTFLSVAEKKD
jgi:hypothetical protein